MRWFYAAWSAFVLAAVAGAAERHVPSEYANLAIAINAAADGDVIVLGDGVFGGPGYCDQFINTKSLTIRSANGPDATVLDCLVGGRALIFVGVATSGSVVEGITFVNGDEIGGGAILCQNTDITIIDCVFENNADTALSGGALRFSNSDPVILGCIFRGNTAVNGGAISLVGGSQATISNCLFVGNTASSRGGALHCANECEALIEFTTFVANRAGPADNPAGGATLGCGSSTSNSSIEIVSSIIWNGGPLEFDCPEITDLEINWSTITGGWPDGNNYGLDPRFADPDGADDDALTFADNDYTLASDSPCIDYRDSGVTLPPTAKDLAGAPRQVDGDRDGMAIVDCGAFEYQPPLLGDVNCDGVVDTFDIEPFIVALGSEADFAIRYPDCDIGAADLNGDEVVDTFDIDPFIGVISNS